MKSSSYYHICAGGIVIALFAYCAISYAVPAGSLHLTYPPATLSPAIRLVPEARVSDLKQDSTGSYKEILAEPVYLDIQSPGIFEDGTIRISYANPDGYLLKFGDVKYGKLEHYYFSSLPRTDTGPRSIDIPIDFSKLDYRGHRYRIAFSLSERPETSHVRIYGITADLKRPPFTWSSPLSAFHLILP